MVGIILGILGTAFGEGMLTGIGVKAGMGVDQDSLAIMVMRQFCDALKPLETGGMVGMCGKFLALLIVISIVSAIISIAITAGKHDDWKIGLGVYSVGWFFGFLFILMFA